MVQFMTLVNNTIRKLQLQGEIALLDRESTLRQKFLGVELYDLIEEQHQQQHQQQKALLRNKDGKNKNNNNNNNKDVTTTTTTITTLKEDVEKFTTVLAVFRNVERTIQDSLEECRRDIQKLHEGAATTTAALPVPVPVPQPLVSVFVNKRKEDFGLAIWPIVSQPQWLHERLGEELEAESMLHNTNNKNNTNNKTMLDTVAVARRAFVEGTKTTITKAIGKLSPEERAVEACVDRAKKDVAVLTAEQQQKQNEINELVLGGTTLECCVVMEGAS